jgi:hypothetical protein
LGTLCFLISVSSSVIPGMTVAPGQAKVLVAKMPTIPPQLLGAEPSTGLSEALQEDKLPGRKMSVCYQMGIWTEHSSSLTLTLLHTYRVSTVCTVVV